MILLSWQAYRKDKWSSVVRSLGERLLPELGFLAPKMTPREKDPERNGSPKWADKGKGLGILGVEVRCRREKGSSINYGDGEEERTISWQWSECKWRSSGGKGFDLFLDFTSQGYLHLKGVHRAIPMRDVRALSIACDRRAIEMGLRCKGMP